MYLLMKMRILTYGAKYNFASECGRCGVSSRIEVDLTTLDVIDLPDTFIEPFECSLPICGEKIWLKFLRGYDDEAVMAYVKRGSDRGAPILGDPAYIPMIAKAIHHTDKITETDEPGKILFVQNLKSLDSLTISDTVDSHKFGIEMKRTFTCPSCGNESEGNIPFNEEFFRPKLRRAT
jgi:transcription elongation factor Elf1